MFEGQASPEIRSKLVDRGIAVIGIDPAASGPAEGDLLSVMRASLDALESVAPD